ncbi:hypothetical protein B5V01_22195 [Mesorhizobium erdmanii]|uniref:Transposase IS110-like N-terminal domain-containing protein n=1 Tax=Mesorhizobium erdmanii TaxID=1777866 RepID=A0A4Q1UWK4_9HYPH|nr:hypothetical protein B5V01_22195 [Mesorhizobium erdmanii]
MPIYLRRIDLERGRLLQFATKLKPDDEIVIEATGNTSVIVRLLSPFVGRVVIANPILVRAIAWAKVKTDKIDAAVLAKLHASGFLPEVWMPDEETETRRRVVAERTQLVSQMTRLKNRIHSVLPRHPGFCLSPRLPCERRIGGHQGQCFSFPAPFQGQQLWEPAGYTTTTDPRSQRNRAIRRGRPDNNSNSRFIRYLGLPAMRAPDTPIPVGRR